MAERGHRYDKLHTLRRGALGFPQFDVSIEAIVPLFTAAASDTPRAR